MRKRIAAVCAASLLTAGGVAAAAVAAPASPAVTDHGGAKASLYATGLNNPTSFAWVKGTMFAGDSGNGDTRPGGVFLIKDHVGQRISSTLRFVGGLASRKGVLYISGADAGPHGEQWQILAWSGWNGTTFTSQKAIYTAPKGFEGFNGLGFAHDGRLLVGVDTGLGNDNDHGPASTSPYLYDILSMTPGGQDLRVFARGIRQPWQMAFASRSNRPFVSDLGQDEDATNPPDFILKVKQGQNYGFPKCNHTSGSPCNGYAKPFKTLKPHADPMGLAVIGKKLYVGSYTGGHHDGGGALYVMRTKGGALKPVVTNFPIQTDALAAHGGKLYVGGSTSSPESGDIYQVTL